MHYQPVENMGDDAYIVHGGEHLQPETLNDTFDDVFGGHDDESAETSHPSDMRRLETEHATAGYREGINVGKQATLQQGFDDGYTMGAAIGLQAGQVLGVLEGIVEALDGRGPETLTKAESLLADARTDLGVERLFSSDYWKSSGEPSYGVDRDVLQTKDGALAHPLVRKWTDVLEEQLRAWKIDRSILDHVNPEPQPQQERASEEPHEHAGESVTRDPLDW